MSSLLGYFFVCVIWVRSRQLRRWSAIVPLPFPWAGVSGKLIVLMIQWVPQAPILPSLLMTLAPDVECEKLCWYSCYSWHSSASSETADSIPDAAGKLSRCPAPPQPPPRIGVPDSLPSLLGQAGGMLSSLHAEQARAGGHRAQGFRGRPIHLMHNSWPLWTFQLRPLSLMGNPNGDLFIKTISWLFVVPASHEGATSRPGIITSSFDSSVLTLHFDYINVCQIIYCTWSINPHLSLV